MIGKLSNHLGVPRYVLLCIFAVVCLWTGSIVATGANINLFPVEWDFTNSGAFGDSFGPLSAIMASAAALSAIAAYRSQAAEIIRAKERQANDDARHRDELLRLEERQIQLDNAASKSNFEETFFRLLHTFSSIVNRIDIKTSNGQVKVAHDAFDSIVKYAKRSAEIQGINFSAAWTDTAQRYRNDLNHYFRFMYHIILFVDSSPIENKYFYVRLVRALLSESEMILLGLNCEYGDGKEKFKNLVEKYALLHNLSEPSRKMWFKNSSLSITAFEVDQ